MHDTIEVIPAWIINVQLSKRQDQGTSVQKTVLAVMRCIHLGIPREINPVVRVYLLSRGLSLYIPWIHLPSSGLVRI